MTAIAFDPRGAGAPMTHELSSDATLARHAAAGDDAAYAAIYTRYHARLEAYCRAIVRHDEDARDAAQNAMTKALVAMRAHGETLHLRAWLYRIAHNEALTVLRRRRHHDQLTDELEGLRSDPVIEVLLRERLRATLDALGALPASHRQALLLRELGGLDYATIAEATGLTPRAARQAVFRARRAMRADRAAAEHSQCSEIRGVLAGNDGRRRRARRVRAHLRTCGACRDWDAARRPPLPRALSILPTAWATAAGSLWSWLAAAVGGSSGGVGAVTATKLVTGAAILAAGTGPIAQHEMVHRERRASAPHRGAAAATTGTTAASPLRPAGISAGARTAPRARPFTGADTRSAAARGDAHSTAAATRSDAHPIAPATRGDAHPTGPATRGDARSAGPATRTDSAAPATRDDAHSAGGRPIDGGVEDLGAAPPLRVDPAPAPPAADVGSAGTRSPSTADTHDAASPAR
jgi:RNA polymerase sigma factor (sigma-70 family)